MLLLISFLIVAAVVFAKISSRYNVPVLIAFLGIGILFGSDVLNLFYFDDAELTKKIADILLVFILFDGGFRTTKKQIHLAAKIGITLATLGVVVTTFVLGIIIYKISQFNFFTSMTIASIISSTDAAAVMSITRQYPIKERIAAILNVESALNDPLAIILTITFASLAIGVAKSPVNLILSIIWQFIGGISFGFIVSAATKFLFNKLEFENRGYYYILIVGMILFCYSISTTLAANGIIAVFIMGYRLGNCDYVAKKSVSNFLEGINSFANFFLFLMLGLLAFPRNFIYIWKTAIVISIVIIFVARPIAVFISTIRSKLSFVERSFISYGGIKGAVPIVLATYPSAFKMEHADLIFNIIFAVVLISCLLQGSFLGVLARMFKLSESPRTKNPYSMELHGVRKSEHDMLEIHLVNDAKVLGSKISDLNLDKNILITSIVRDGRIVAPKGHTVLESGDILFILAPTRLFSEIDEMFN